MPEFFHEFLNLRRPVGFVQQVHKEHNYWSDKCHKNAHNPNVGARYLNDPKDLVDDPLKLSHVTFLHKLMVMHSLFNLFLGKVNVVGEQLQQFLTDLILSFLFLLQLQVPHVDLRIQLPCNSIKQHVDPDVQRMLQDIFKAADATT